MGEEEEEMEEEEEEEEELDDITKAARAIVDMSLFLTTKVGSSLHRYPICTHHNANIRMSQHINTILEKHINIYKLMCF